MPRNKLILAIMAAGFLSFPARANDKVLGYIKIVSGEAVVTSESSTVPAQPGMPLYLGNILKTGENGGLGMTFKDNTVISLGPNTEVTIDEYLYAPANDELKLSANLIKGALHYISGVIAKLKPEAVSVKTPSGIIGVRGTRFLVKVEAQ
ncbi:FecR family protein [Methylomonas sp. MgM2]